MFVVLFVLGCFLVCFFDAWFCYYPIALVVFLSFVVYYCMFSVYWLCLVCVYVCLFGVVCYFVVGVVAAFCLSLFAYAGVDCCVLVFEVWILVFVSCL